MQYDEHRLALLAATVAAGFAANSKLLDALTDKKKVRAEARNLARVSVLLARHIMVAAHRAAEKVDALELLYDDADFL
jgi:RsiW-degrading membrane proteinase PrsW (M82 family)